MNNFRITLFRTNYGQMAIGAADMGDCDMFAPEITESGWSTRYDGGRGYPTPWGFVAIYGEAYLGSGCPSFYALVRTEDSANPQIAGKRVFKKFNGDISFDLGLDGINLVTSAAEWGKDWVEVEEGELPEDARLILKKTFGQLRRQFGQGHDFFQDLSDVIRRENLKYKRRPVE
ncbi:hypothetical protein ACFL2B_02440 [Patescibacteria group bacterium]